MTGPSSLPGGAGAVGVVAVGLDLVEVLRLERALQRRPALAGRLFTDAEIDRCSGARRPAERYAVRFAAKEAAMKALGVGIGAGIWRDVEVLVGRTGEPSLVVTGRAAELAMQRGGTHWLVSLTHTGGLAQAVVLLCAE